MKVGTKFALAFVACAFLGVLLYSAVAASREVNDLEATVAEDLASLGRTLSVSVRAVWERDGETRARELVEVHDRDDAIEARWTWLDVEENDPLAPRLGAGVTPALRAGEVKTWIGDRRSGRRVYAYVPLRVSGGRPAALELSRSLVSPSHMFWAELRRQLFSSAVTAVLATVVAVGLASLLVSRPLAVVASQARRIGAGDLSQRLPERGKDEVAALIRDLNAMCDQLRDARNRAEDETQKRIAALEQLRHADRLRTVGTLASGIAHELGTPLAVISMRAKMIATGEVDGDDALGSAKVIGGQADRVARIVRQLLDFARRRTPQTSDVDLAELAERTTGLLDPLARKRSVRVEVVKPDAPVRASVDASQVEQALTNLVINAVQATASGGTVTVRAFVSEAAPNEGEPRRPCAVLQVEDHGDGIAPEHLERIFEPFFTTKSVGEGTGLGLPITYGIVLDHSGWMHADTERGRGTTFSVYLPIRPDAPAS